MRGGSIFLNLDIAARRECKAHRVTGNDKQLVTVREGAVLPGLECTIFAEIQDTRYHLHMNSKQGQTLDPWKTEYTGSQQLAGPLAKSWIFSCENAEH